MWEKVRQQCRHKTVGLGPNILPGSVYFLSLAIVLRSSRRHESRKQASQCPSKEDVPDYLPEIASTREAELMLLSKTNNYLRSNRKQRVKPHIRVIIRSAADTNIPPQTPRTNLQVHNTTRFMLIMIIGGLPPVCWVPISWWSEGAALLLLWHL